MEHWTGLLERVIFNLSAFVPSLCLDNLAIVVYEIMYLYIYANLHAG